MLCNRVKKNMKRLRKWSAREGIECYRIYGRDIPELPIVIDWYQGRLHIAEYNRKHASGDCGGEAWLKTVVAMTALELGVSADKIYYKVRDRQRGQKQYQARGTEDNRFIVEEAGHSFLVNLVDYLDTGLFLDHRRTRSMVAEESSGKSVLNLFCYTGSFSVYAGAAGAANTLGIDLSATYLEWARANLEANELDRTRNRLRRGDVMEVLADIGRTGERFDIAVVDPPTFSNSKRMEGVFDIQRDHVALLSAVRAVLAPGGVVYFSTNHRRFAFDEPELSSLYGFADISKKTLPEDFRDKKVHRCWRLEENS
ncbi:MAG: methyltransferase domain-containing protein [Myxococcales bacterium]|nr:methyltransferase domain-containing protein [Myxococcales bacterium]